MIGSFKAEILKLRKRPATWVLLGVAVLFAVFALVKVIGGGDPDKPALPDDADALVTLEAQDIVVRESAVAAKPAG